MLAGCKVMMSKIIGLSLTSNTATIPSEERCLEVMSELESCGSGCVG